MIELYIDLVKAHPVASSAVQVAILGMLGELIAVRLKLGRWHFFTPLQFVLKVIVWGFLGITFKYAFAGFYGFVDALVEKELWPAAATAGIMRAFSISLFTNMLFGPVMMLFHRWTDNLIENRDMDWASMLMAWFTLLWFWIPAHTITFSLPEYFQVGLAAIWAIALGIILGGFAHKNQES